MLPKNSYPTDLNEAQWKVIAPLIPQPGAIGRPLKHERRHIVDAILYNHPDWLRLAAAST